MRCPFCAALAIGVAVAASVEATEPVHQPRATCLTPVPAHVTLQSPETDARAVLGAWEAAAASVEPVGKSERQRMEYMLRDAYSAHELALATEFRGPVRADDLRRRYAWSRSSRRDGVTRLSAEPRETAEALFVPRFTIEFDDLSGLPAVIEFGRREASGETVASATARIELDPVLQLRPENPGESTLIQTVSHATIASGEESEAEGILRRWAESTASIQSLEVGFERTIYDHVFQVEKRSTGSLSVVPDGFRYEVRPVSEPDERPSRRASPAGAPYKVVAERSEAWEISGKQIRFEDASGRMDEWTAPAATQRTAEPDAWFTRFVALFPKPTDLLPGIVPVSREEPLNNWSVQAVHMRDAQVLLKLTPKSRGAMAQFREVQVVLDTAEWRPQTVRSFDPAGNLETLHLLSGWRVARNEPRRLVPPPPAEPAALRQAP